MPKSAYSIPASLSAQNQIVVESMAASARHLTTNRPSFFRLNPSHCVPAEDTVVLGGMLSVGLWVLPSRRLAAAIFRGHFKDAERIETAAAIVLFLKVQICSFKSAFRFETRPVIELVRFDSFMAPNERD
jgi:hypothetical protein